MPDIIFSPSLGGSFTAFDLLTTDDGILFPITSKQDLRQVPIFFLVVEDGFIFSFNTIDNLLLLQRNETAAVLDISTIPEGVPFHLYVTWTFTQLTLICAYKVTDPVIIKQEVPTKPCAPPPSLISWAKKQNLIPTEEYENEEALREKVHALLLSIQIKTAEAGAFTQFWNFQYNGGSISARIPKREVEVHPTIHCLLSDQALLASLEIIPEYHTGIGNLDFMVIGKIRNGGLAKIFVEFKNAHSEDLEHGLTHQLPAYMRNKNIKYGVYCILNYKGEWFDEPDIHESRLELKMFKVADSMIDPLRNNIRTIIFNLSKPKSASK